MGDSDYRYYRDRRVGEPRWQSSERNNQINRWSYKYAARIKKAEEKPRLTLDDGWSIDTSNPYMTQVVGTVSNNSDKDIKGYIQITFSALDADGANVGDCLANANTVDANGKWKFKAMCSGDDIKDVRFKEISGF